jgi:hypothetical protein
MADKTLLCTCVICLKENSNGIQLTLNTYNRHRKRQQELLEKDNVENQNVKNVNQNVKDQNIEDQNEDILHQEEFQTEDINKSVNENLVDEVDEDFNINEDNEDYSDYDNDEHDDNNEEYDDIEEDEEEYEDNNNEDTSDEDTNDEDTMQIDNESDTIPNKKIIEGLKLLHLKSLYNFTESAYDDIMKIFVSNNISLYKIKKYLNDVTGLVPIFYDMCENSCICYTGQYESYQNCPICNSTRLDTRGKAKKVMPYLSIINRLKMQFNDKNRAKELLYRHEYITNKQDDDLDDIFDGNIYKELVNNNLFNDKRDIAFIASCDGYQIFKQKTDDCWLFLIITVNP